MTRSKYFATSEFRCRDGSPYPDDWGDRFESLTSQLDIIREAWGSPVMVVSGYRSATYNQKVGGARNSQHVQGRAADIRPMAIRNGVRVAWEELDTRERLDTIAAFDALVERLVSEGRLPRIGGVGLYPGRWVHVDVRARKEHVARWTGTGLGSEKTG